MFSSLPRVVLSFGSHYLVAVETARPAVGIACFIQGAKQIILVFVLAAFGQTVGFVADFAASEVIEFGAEISAAFGLGEKEGFVGVEIVADGGYAGNGFVEYFFAAVVSGCHWQSCSMIATIHQDALSFGYALSICLSIPHQLSIPNYLSIANYLSIDHTLSKAHMLSIPHSLSIPHMLSI